MTNSDHVAFRVGDRVSSDLRDLFLAIGTGDQIEWYTRLQMKFMAAAGLEMPLWKQFAEGPALTMRKLE